jgi:hypothetical protein
MDIIQLLDTIFLCLNLFSTLLQFCFDFTCMKWALVFSLLLNMYAQDHNLILNMRHVNLMY